MFVEAKASIWIWPIFTTQGCGMGISMNGRGMVRGSVPIGALLAVAVAAVVIGLANMRKAPAPSTAASPAAVAGQAYPYMANSTGMLFRVGNRADLPDETGLVPFEGNEAGNRHVVQVSRQAAEHAAATKGGLTIQLPAGERFAVQFERAERAPNGDWTFIGKVATRLGPQSAVLTFGRAGLFGVLPTPQGSQMQISTTRGVTVLEPVRPMHPRNPQTGELPIDYVVPEDAKRVKPAPAGAGEPHHVVGLSEQFAPIEVAAAKVDANAVVAEVQVDVLGLYTKNMTELRGSAAAAETECNNYLAITNQAHRDSGTGVRLNFVGLREINYPATALNESALDALSGNQMPDGTDVKQLRDSVRADLVAMFRPYVTGDNNAGIAYVAGFGLQGVGGARDSAGFSVSNLNTYTFAHEIGHNLGSAHDVETQTNAGTVSYGAYLYSFGYRQDSPAKFATIMAYPTDGQPRIGYFSHPGTSACLQGACGTEAADNARSIRNMVSAIAEYRLPAGMLFTNSAAVIEGDSGSLWERRVSVTVKLSTPAPVGGVKFNLATVDATARAGADYVALSQTGVLIPEGQSSYAVSIKILPDELVEGDETFRLVISGVEGAQVYRGEAIMTIVDDDPRVVVSGRFLPPSGLPLPTSQFQIAVTEIGPTGAYDSASYWVIPPEFQYRIPVQKGSSVSVATLLQAPYARSTFDLGIVNAARVQDLTLQRSVKLTGRLRFPAGQSLPTAPILVYAWGHNGNVLNAVGVYANPPEFQFAHNVLQGAQIRLDASDPPAPFVPQHIAIGEVWSDRVQDIEMRSVPSLVVIGTRVKEGASGQNQNVQLQMRLSTAAPTDGAHVDVELLSGTAIAGRDFVSRAKTRLTIGSGNDRNVYTVVIQGDSVPERGEYLRVVLSNPAGAWLPSPEAIVHIDDDDPGIPRSDANGDGRSDLFFHNESSQQFSSWLMNGATATGGSGQAIAAGFRVIGAGDLNGDGLRDMVWRDTSRRELWLWQGSANGQFQVQSLGPHPDGDYSLVGVSDVDGDGKEDLLWHSRTRGTLTLWLMDGPFRRGDGSSAISSRFEVAGVGDLTGDGRADVVWRDSERTEVWLWAAQPAGGFAPRFISPHPPAPWDLIGVEDLDGDGRADLVWHDAVRGQLDTWLMNGETRRGAMSQAIPPQYQVVAFADLNGDGRQDLVWADRARTELWAWLGTASGIFTPTFIAGHPVGGWQLTSPRTDYPQAPLAPRAKTDINGDGRSDLTWRNANAQRTAWWLMNGSAFTVPAEQAAGSQFSIVARSDFDGDGRQDMLWTDSARTQLWMWIARGTGFEVHAMGAHPPAGWTVVASADIDGDGRSDLMWHNPERQQLDWWYMNGASRVAMGSQFIPSQYRVVVAGDFDGDRRSDIVWRDLASTELWRWAGDGASFSASRISAYPTGWLVVAAGDVDGDGRDDLVWHNAAAGQVNWWLMQGAQRIGTGSQAIPSKYAVADYGDLDGDGRLDLVWVDDRRTEIWMWHEAGPNRTMRASFIGTHPGGDWNLVTVH